MYKVELIPICVLTDYITLHSSASLAIQTCHLVRRLVLLFIFTQNPLPCYLLLYQLHRMLIW